MNARRRRYKEIPSKQRKISSRARVLRPIGGFAECMDCIGVLECAKGRCVVRVGGEGGAAGAQGREQGKGRDRGKGRAGERVLKPGGESATGRVAGVLSREGYGETTGLVIAAARVDGGRWGRRDVQRVCAHTRSCMEGVGDGVETSDNIPRTF